MVSYSLSSLTERTIVRSFFSEVKICEFVFLCICVFDYLYISAFYYLYIYLPGSDGYPPPYPTQIWFFYKFVSNPQFFSLRVLAEIQKNR